MTWADVWLTIRTAVASAAGVPLALVVDENGPQPFAGGIALVRLNVIADRGIEWPPLTKRTVRVDLRYDTEHRQQREAVVSCRVETLSSDAASTALPIAQNIQSGLNMLGVEEITTTPDYWAYTGPGPILEAGGVVAVRVSTITPHAVPVDGRILSVYTLDLTFRYPHVRDDPGKVRTIGTAHPALNST